MFAKKGEPPHHVFAANDKIRFRLFSFISEASLQSHMKNVHRRPKENSICHVCAKVYSSVVNLQLHMMDHNDIQQPRVDCQLCGNSFKNERSLRKHMYKHRDEGQTFQCPQCPKISHNRNALARHIRSVHNYTVHKCHLCDREFKRAVALTVGI